MTTSKDDIVLDYHLGSGTTCAVAHKLGRKYIGIEQLDYGENDSVIRLQNVINGEQTGISKICNWKGGGSFKYCELANFSYTIIPRINEAKNKEELLNIINEIIKNNYNSYAFDLQKYKNNNVDNIDLSDLKKIILSIIEKNNLYVNFSEIDDEIYNISQQTKKLNINFYNQNL